MIQEQLYKVGIVRGVIAWWAIILGGYYGVGNYLGGICLRGNFFSKLSLQVIL